MDRMPRARYLCGTTTFAVGHDNASCRTWEPGPCEDLLRGWLCRLMFLHVVRHSLVSYALLLSKDVRLKAYDQKWVSNAPLPGSRSYAS